MSRPVLQTNSFYDTSIFFSLLIQLKYYLSQDLVILHTREMDFHHKNSEDCINALHTFPKILS